MSRNVIFVIGYGVWQHTYECFQLIIKLPIFKACIDDTSILETASSELLPQTTLTGVRKEAISNNSK
jgi:hypothetical protein